MKVLYLTIFLLVYCYANDKPKQKSETNVLIDSLFSNTFQDKYMQDEVYELAQKLTDIGGSEVVDALYKFALTNKLYGDQVINALFALHPKELANWIETNQNTFTESQWHYISINYERTAFKWNDSTLNKLILHNAISSSNENIRNSLLVSIATVGSFSLVNKIRPMVTKETDVACRKQIYRALCRFPTPENDSNVKIALTKYSEPQVISRWLESGIQDYSRYDFLPELYALKSRLEKVNDVTKVAEAKETLEILKTVIPYLEQKKAENAPIGLPLNWPEGNVQK